MFRTMLTALWKTLGNERGQIPGSVEDESTPESLPAEPAAPAPAEEVPAATPAQEGEAQDTFVDPKQLPPELQGHFKRMQAAYTKKMQNFAKGREALDLVERFNTDPQIRKQILQQYQHELGIPVTQTPTGTGTPKGADAPAEFVENFKSNLPTELHWMAQSLANGFWKANQAAMAPLQQQLQNQTREAREQEFETLASELPPGWEAHEDEMSDLLDFLQGSSMRHPVYGSKHALLYRLATGQETATSQAIERMQRATDNRTHSSRNVGRVASNINERILKSRNVGEAVRIAGEAAMEQLGIK